MHIKQQPGTLLIDATHEVKMGLGDLVSDSNLSKTFAENVFLNEEENKQLSSRFGLEMSCLI